MRIPFIRFDTRSLGLCRLALGATVAITIASGQLQPAGGAAGTLVAALCLIPFMLGLRTRLFHALLWLVVALPGLLAGLADAPGSVPVLELMLTWMLRLPLGARLSLDALRASMAARRELTAAELADRQLMALQASDVRSLMVPVVWLQLAGTAWLLASARIPALPASLLLVLVPVLTLGEGQLRWLASRVGARLSSGHKLECFFDAGCGVCFQLARALARMDHFGRVELLSNVDTARLPEGVTPALVEQTIVVRDLDRGTLHTRADAVAMLCRALPLGILPWALLSAPGLSWVWGVLYDAFARNRVRISTSLGLAACEIPPR